MIFLVQLFLVQLLWCSFDRAKVHGIPGSILPGAMIVVLVQAKVHGMSGAIIPGSIIVVLGRAKVQVSWCNYRGA